MFFYMRVISFVVCHMLMLNHRLFTKTLITSVIKGVMVIYILAQLKVETFEPDFLLVVEEEAQFVNLQRTK